VVEVLILTEEFAVDLGNCLRWRKLTALCLRPGTDLFRQKIRWAESAVIFCAYEVVELLSVVSHFLIDVHKFDFRIVVNKITASCSDINRCFDRICTISHDRRREC
jgi:hypothetical protein